MVGHRRGVVSVGANADAGVGVGAGAGRAVAAGSEVDIIDLIATTNGAMWLGLRAIARVIAMLHGAVTTTASSRLRIT